jgi:ComF family protein
VHTILAAYPYEGLIRSAIQAFKYEGLTRLDHFLARALVHPLSSRPLSVDLVVPVPLSAQRHGSRGFNQAEVLARPLAAATGWTLDAGLMVRARDTRPQVELPHRARRSNVQGAFSVTNPDAVAGRRVLLVDDVCTTGATLEACAVPLLDAGAAGVWGLVIARAMRSSGDGAGQPVGDLAFG